MNKAFKIFAWSAAAFGLTAAFQNCSDGNFESTSSHQSSTQAGGSPGGGPPPGPSPGPAPTPSPAPLNIGRTCMGNALTNERYSQPAPLSVPAGVSFLSDFAGRPVAGGFGAVQAMDTCRYKADPVFKTWHGKTATRVELNPGDSVAGGERAEVLFAQSTTGADLSESSASGLVFYGMSYYFPANWAATFTQGDSQSWSLLFQFHPGNGNGYFAGLQAGLRTAAEGQSFYYAGGVSSKFNDGSKIILGKWVDFIWAFNFSSGQLQVYRRNEGQTKFTLVLSLTDNSMVRTSPSYFKQGLYRGPNVNGRTDVLWIGPTSRGSSFAAVEQASFGTSNGF